MYQSFGETKFLYFLACYETGCSSYCFCRSLSYCLGKSGLDFIMVYSSTNSQSKSGKTKAASAFAYMSSAPAPDQLGDLRWTYSSGAMHLCWAIVNWTQYCSAISEVLNTGSITSFVWLATCWHCQGCVCPSSPQGHTGGSCSACCPPVPLHLLVQSCSQTVGSQPAMVHELFHPRCKTLHLVLLNFIRF